MGFLSTALEPQHFAHKIVGQERLARYLEEIERAQITTICAPPGYGKTAAMVRWTEMLAQAGQKIIWISCRAGIADHEAFIRVLQTALQRMDLTLPALSTDIDIATHLVEVAAAQDAGLVLAIDDAHLLPEEVQRLIGRFAELAGNTLTTMLAFRGAPRVAFARLQSLGLLYELESADLRLSYDEMVEFVTQNGLAMLDEASLQQLFDDTQGWAVGIAMASARLRKLGGFSASPAAGRFIADVEKYFCEEVLSALPDEIQSFLTDTAILDELTPPACDAVTGRQDAGQVLSRLAEAGVFITVLDAEAARWTYHPLFRKTVQRRQDQTRGYELHRRASLYYAGNGEANRAMEHAAFAGDHDFLADQLDLLAESLTYNGYLYRIEELCSTLPFTVMARRPMILLTLAWHSIRRLSFHSAEKLIEAAAQRIEQLKAEGIIDESRFETLQRHIAHRRIMLDAGRDDMPKVEHAAEKLLHEIRNNDVYLSCTLLAQLMSARRDLYHFQDMQKLEAEIRRALSMPGSDFASIALKASVAPTLVVQGKTEAARRMLEESLALAQRLHGKNSGLAALPALPLSELLYDCGERDAARALVEEHMPAARQWGFVDQLASGYLVRAKLLVEEGNTEMALSGLEEANLVAIECGLDRLRALIMAERVRILIRLGDHIGAQRVFHASGLAHEGEPLPTLTPNRQSETVAVAWLRLQIKNNRLQQARKVAYRWCELARRVGVARSVVVFELLLAEIMVLSGNRSEARRAVREAVIIAAQAGWTRIFLDEGEVIGSLLTEAYGQGPILDTLPDRFAAKLAVAFKGGPVGELGENFGLGSKLANRELDILTMVAGGLRNREIGNRLGLTEGTVKWYMQQIYDKLGVRRRPQAVIRARQLGVLN
jgi:LuxR family maltose regulon positive regulatory protein